MIRLPFRRKSRRTQETVPLVALDAGGSVVGEQFRALRTNLELLPNAAEVKTLVVTSANPAEGKSMLAANLAIVYAELGKSVLLVDSDLRRPCLSRTFKLHNMPGISNLVGSETDVDYKGLIHESQVPNLSVVASGPPIVRPIKALTAPAMTRFIKEVRAAYDLVIFDLPPVVTVSDAQIIASQADGTIVVARKGQTTKRSYQKACQLLARSNAQLLGVVFNETDPMKGKYYYY